LLYQLYLHNHVWRLSERKEKRLHDTFLPDWRIVHTMKEEDFKILISDFPLTYEFIKNLDCNRLEEMEYALLYLIFELVDMGSYSDRFVTLSKEDHIYWYVKSQKSETFPHAIDALSTLLKG